MTQSEGVRLYLAVSAESSMTKVCAALGVSRALAGQWVAGRSVPNALTRSVALELYGIPVSSWDEPALPPPPPPSREKIVEALHIGGTFLEFITEGPPQFPATPQQRVLIRIVFDNEQPRDLVGEDREIARVLLGEVDTIPDSARRKAVLRLGRESAKSTITGAYSVFRLLTADLSTTFKNTLPSVVFFSSDAETTKTIFDMASQYLKDIKLASEKTEKDNAEAIIFERPTDGRRVRLRVIVRSAGGVRGRGFPIVAAIVDEAEFMRAAKDDAVIQDEAVIDALLFRMTPGAKVILLSTPWEEESYAGNLHAANWQNPTTAVAVLGRTVFLRNNDPHVVALRAELMKSDEKAARRELDVEVVSMGNVLVPAELVDAAVARGKAHGVVARKKSVSAGIDLGLRRDRSTLLLTERQESILVVVGLHERTPRPGRPLSGPHVCEEFADITRAAGGRHMTGDSHRAEALREAALDANVEVAILDNKAEDIATYLASLFREGRIAIPDDPRLVKQIKSVRTRAKPGGGLEIVRPRTKDGHCDLESALECAAWADKRHGAFTAARASSYRFPSPIRGGFTT